MNSVALSNAASWLSSGEWKKPTGKPALHIIGPLSSGKTSLVSALVAPPARKNHLELSGLDDPRTFARRLREVAESHLVKTVAEYAGLSYGPRVDVVVVEDAEFLDPAAGARALREFCGRRLVPVVCISCEPLPQSSLSPALFKQIRIFRPTVRQAAKELQRYAEAVGLVDLKDDRIAVALSSRFDGDIRQAKIELDLLFCRSARTVLRAEAGRCDVPQRSASEVARTLFAASTATAAILTACDRDDSSAVRALVAENYIRARDVAVHGLAAAAEDVSMGDALWSASREAADLFGIGAAVACGSRAGLVGRAEQPPRTWPYAVQNAARVPRDAAEAIERRIVWTLARAGPRAAGAVAREMRSLGLATIADWDAVRLLVAVGTAPRVVDPAARLALAKELRSLSLAAAAIAEETSA